MTKFKTHEELGITFAEYGALLGVLMMLEQGTLEHDSKASKPVPNKHLFNMNEAIWSEHCGTVGCIGGHMAIIMGMGQRAAQSYVLSRSGGDSSILYPLFYPSDHNYATITSQEAATAIRGFLTTGVVDWSHVEQKPEE